MAVTEPIEGTMTEAEEQAKAASEAKGKTPEDESKVSPKGKEQVEEPKLYSQKELDSVVHVKSSEDG